MKFTFPTQTGVYVFKDKNNKVLYIGKAINLQERIKSHFQNDPQDLRLAGLIAKTTQVDCETTSSELEALLLEVKLIKTYRPFYNSRLKDSKRYLYVGFTREKYPRLVFLRQPEKTSALLDWFGPFPDAAALKELVLWLRRIFPYRTCTQTGKPCFYYHLHLCPGVCFQEVPKYRQTVKQLRLFFSGKITGLTRHLRRQVLLASRRKDYENAQLFQKQINLLEKLLGRYHKMPKEAQNDLALAELRLLVVKHQGIEPIKIHRLEAYDIANLGHQIIVGAMVVFTQGEADSANYRRFRIRSSRINDPADIQEVLMRRLKHQEWIYPQVILVDGGKGQLSFAHKALVAYQLEKEIALIGLAKKKETLIFPCFEQKKWFEINLLANSNLLQLLQRTRNEAHRFAQRYYRQLHLQSTLAVSNSSKN